MEQLDKEFENFIRKNLDQQPAEPDADLWDAIAQEQGKRNAGLRRRWWLRRLGQWAAVLAVVLAAWYWWWSVQTTQTTPVPSAGAPIAAAPLPAPAYADSISNPAAPTNVYADEMKGAHNPHDLPAWYPRNQVPVDRIRFIAELGLEYQSPISGNTVRIPANSLVDAQGQPVQGEVELLFREYRNIPDFLASDLPMHYSDERGRFAFNSGGMFDVRVARQGQALNIAPGKTYEVDFTPTAALSNAAMYFFEDQSRQWQYISQKAFGADLPRDAGGRPVFNQHLEQENDLPLISDENTVASENMAAYNRNQCLPELLRIPAQEDPAEWARKGIQTGYEITQKKMEVPGWFKKFPDGKDIYFSSALERSDIRIVRSEDAQTRFFPDDKNNFFTELSVFKDCYFVRLGDTLANLPQATQSHTANAIFNRIQLWQSVNIYQVKGAECTIELGNGDEGVKISARVYSSQSWRNAQEFNPDQLFASFERMRAERQRNLRQQLGMLRNFMAVANLFKTEKEQCMTAKNWLIYFEKNREIMRARYGELVRSGLADSPAALQQLVNAWQDKARKLHFEQVTESGKPLSKGQALGVVLQLAGFGTYNCDQIFRLGKHQSYAATRFMDAAGQVLQAATLRLINRDSRIFLSLDARSEISFFPGRPMDMILTDVRGKLFYLPGKTYSQLPLATPGENLSFTMQEITDRAGTPMDWAELLDI
jgi:hypothetical protein